MVSGETLMTLEWIAERFRWEPRLAWRICCIRMASIKNSTKPLTPFPDSFYSSSDHLLTFKTKVA